MAGEAPPSDVLCEAMEYLSKLGTNLRSRSESLKDKRINKDKLRNCQAVRKAAQKVLLICQLSKKSLENVESGVNAILNRLEQDNAIKIVPKSELKLPKSVNLKHFKSVSVLVRSMPMSMLDKYPVRHDCKLLRLRRRRAMKQKIVDSENKDVKKNSTSTKMRTNSNDGEEKNDEQVIRKEDMSAHSPKVNLENPEKENTNFVTKEKARENGHSAVKNTNFVEESSVKENIEISDTKPHRRMSESEEKHSKVISRKSSVELDPQKKTKTSQEEKKSRKEDSVRISGTHEKSKETHQKHSESNKSIKKFKKVRILDSSSSDNEDIKNTSVIDLDSNDDDDSSGKKENELAEQAKKDVEPVDSAAQDSNNSNIEEKEQKQDEDAIKPLIKCVSLSKLLKPEVVAKDKTKTNNTPLICKLPISNNTMLNNGVKKPLLVHLDGKRHILSKELQSDYKVITKTNSQKQPHSKPKKMHFKRIQLLYFVPKQFDIKVCQLPKITEDFLQKYNLTKVTQNGKVVCEITRKISNDKTLHDIDSLDEPGKQLSDVTSKNSPQTSAKKAKSALLDDSDEDNVPIGSNETDTLRTSSKKVIEVLQNKGSNDELERNQPKDTDKAKNALLKDSDGENSDTGQEIDDTNKKTFSTEKRNEVVSESLTNAEKAKTTLLNDSDLGDSEVPSKTTISVNNEKKIPSHQISKDLNNDKSLKPADTATAKKALLNDSDGEKSDNVSKRSSNQMKVVASEPKADADKAKTTLLNDSDVEDSEVPPNATTSVNNDKIPSDQTSNDSNIGKSPKPADTDTAKKALLNDSDGEKSDNASNKSSNQMKVVASEPKADADKAKTTLLNDSDIEDSEVPPNTTTSVNNEEKIPSYQISKDLNNDKSLKPADTATAKKALFNDSDGEKSDNVSKKSSNQMKVVASEPKADADKAKTTLLNDSDVEDSEVPPNATTSVNNDKIPSDQTSNDSNIGKSPKPADTDTAKKALLNDSDGEKTDNVSKKSSNRMKVVASEPKTDANKAKTTLLNDSYVEDSEVPPNATTSGNEEKIPSDQTSKDLNIGKSPNLADTDTAKKALLNDSDGEKSDNVSKKSSNRMKVIAGEPKTDANKAKTTLLNDSYVEDSEVPPNATTKKALLNESDCEKSNNVSKKSSNQMKVVASEPKTDANKAKTSLLNDSYVEDSEVPPNATTSVNEEKIPLDQISENLNNEESPKPADTNTAKKVLLNDSDSEKSDSLSKKSSDPISEKSDDESIENNGELNYHSQSEDNPSSINIVENNIEKETVEDTLSIDKSNKVQDQELAKSSLLNDTSGSNSNSPSKTQDSNCKSKSRRKSIMESMHAKKMLLTYSSSSDTEDEKLKSVMKSMKENLLKGIDSDQEEFKEGLRKKLHTSSDSDDDMLKRARKRKKDSSSEDDKPNKKSKSRPKKMGRSREKPGGSSNQNSDTQDDKDIEGLTNLKTLSKSRRRQDSESEQSAKSAGQKKENKMEKKKESLIPIEGGLLDAPMSSSENDSGTENEVEEDLPPISLSELNGGGGIAHLAKDDLLGESESDSSKEHNSDVKQEDGSDSDIKLKRRKANAIDSDSEAGSSRKKVDVRVSDFEDSEEENSEPVKKAKRKKKAASDSDASGGDSSSDGTKKKRRRIKQIDSDASESDTENEGKSKHGRKNIRKVMGKNQLEEATKKAARQERERLARIAERQKLYNNLLFDESGKPDEVILDKVVLDFDPDTKEPLIEVDRGLVKKLKPHQANGIKFMWDACFESVKRIKKDKGSGCILAHCMGLGKTLQVVTLTHTLLIHDELTKVKRVLVVCPLSTVLNWVSEFKMWLKYAESDYDVDVYELSRFKQNSERAFQLSQWFQLGGVCVLGYEMFRNLSADNPKKFKKKMLRQFQESLVDPGPDLVVCDEGHLLKNEKTSLSQSMNRVKTLRRIVLTGTPLQNNLKEYYCMVQFVKPNLLGKYNEYLNRFVNPITNGQYTDSTEDDIRVMKRRSHVLHKMLDGAVQRRDYGVLAPFLPPKHEYVLFITLTEVQIKLYQHYLDKYSRRPLPGKSSGFLFPDFQSLQRIWTHPLVLKYNSERYEIMQQKKREREEEEDSEGSLADFIDDDSTPDETSTEESSDDLSDVSDDSRKKSKKKKAAKKNKKENKVSGRRNTRANPVEMLEENQEDPEIMEVKNDNPTEWWMSLVTDDELEDIRHSNKLVLLFEILRQCEAIGDKLLVFSQSLYSLDLIEHFLGKVDEATQEGRIDEKLLGHVGSWSPGIDYFRLDGSTSCENRSIWCKNFNREDNPRARLFLISTRAGGLGINLVAANRVVIFDVSWNPSHDVQSIFRVYRFGQKKPCYVYRFLAMGTMEEKIYERQVTKQAISKRVIDEQQIDRHYAANDLAELYKFEPRPPAPRPVPLVPKDRFFAEMLKEHESLIYKFHEHDSLLENKEEETLSEEERKAAWEDFENEKNRPPPAPFPSWPMHNGMMPNLLAQQQQQLAYAALAQMLRKDMPNLSDDNIRNMLPIIYGANPGMFGGYDYGLLQKLTDMYKPYSQPGMMNPAMMNPMMNTGGTASGMGGGGSSGLQYEPPWQRQQQQQQQMRLQQLMQHQNQMGAKFYAGGLGSRDPVAMALQQQRAREIMLGGGGGGGGMASAGAGGAGGRPRGRPPMQPRVPVPSTAPGDVVNLDSD